MRAALAAHYADFDLRVEPCLSQIGSGSLPGGPLAQRGVDVDSARWARQSAGSSGGTLASVAVPVIGRIYDGRLWLDLRCLEDESRFMEMLLR